MATATELYVSGAYLEKNPTWHVEESPWKAAQILRLLTRAGISPATICEVGCGAGEVLAQLHARMDPASTFWGYDISPQAIELAKPRANERIRFELADFTTVTDVRFDLILVLDVIEHLEDYFSFLRDLKPKGQYKIIHLPLDLSVQSLLRRNALPRVRKAYGHIHYFTKDVALQTLRDAGLEVVDFFYAPRSIGLADTLAKKLAIAPRALFFAINKDMAVRVLGGYSLMVLAR